MNGPDDMAQSVLAVDFIYNSARCACLTQTPDPFVLIPGQEIVRTDTSGHIPKHGVCCYVRVFPINLCVPTAQTCLSI